MKNILTAVLAGLMFGAYNYCIKLSATHIHEILGAVILQIVAFLLGFLALIYFKSQNIQMEWDSTGIKYAIAAGFFVGLAEIVSFFVFSKGMSISVGVTIIIGVTILTSVLLGSIFLQESISIRQILGMLLIVGGVALLGINGH